MTGYALRRLAAGLLVVLVASLACFALVAAATDPEAEWRAQGVDDATVALRVDRLDLDRPVLARYGAWLGRAVRGDLGQSVSGEPVRERLGRALGVTLRMVAGAGLLAVVGAVAAGLVAARRPHGPADTAGTVVAFGLLAMPVFWLGGVLADLAIRVNDLLGQRVLLVLGNPARPASYVLPVVTLALVAAAEWGRFFRADMLDAAGAPHLRAARARGVAEWRVVAVHAGRTALAGLATVSSLGLARLIGGAVVVERVFSWRGMGSVLLDGVRAADVALVNGWLVVAATAVVVLNLVADLVVARVDPRVRRDG